jgi:hypothetical protein
LTDTRIDVSLQKEELAQREISYAREHRNSFSNSAALSRRSLPSGATAPAFVAVDISATT